MDGDNPRSISSSHFTGAVSSSENSIDPFRLTDDTDSFTGLLLQLSHTHNNQVKKLELKLQSMQRKYRKVYDAYKNNYSVTKELRVEIKELKEDKARLERRLAQLDCDERRNLDKGSDGDQDGDEPVVLNEPANQDDERNTSPEETTKPLRVNKLTKGKTSKKVRYSELDIPLTEATQKDFAELKAAKRSRGDSLKTSPSDHPAHRREALDAEDEIDNDMQGDSQNIVKKSVLADELIGQGASERQHVHAKILVPETCHPYDEMESSPDLDDLYAGGDGRRQPRVISVPETLAVQGDLVGLESLDESDFDPPTCASTPRNLTCSSRISSQRQAKEVYESSSLVNQNDHEHQTVREFDNDETRFVSQRVSQIHRRSLPRSESQYPVDFSSTQLSPKFCGGKDANDDDFGDEVKVILDIKKTPLNTYHGLQTKPNKTPQSINLNDASCQSEASLLLLQPPLGIHTPKTIHGMTTPNASIQGTTTPNAIIHCTTTPNVSQDKDTPSSSYQRLDDINAEHKVRSSTSNWKPNPRKRKIRLDESLEYEDISGKDGLDNSKGTSQKQLSTGRVDEERSVDENDETNLGGSLPDKENSPPVEPLSPEKPSSSSRPHLSSNQMLDISEMQLKSSAKGGKVLKQSRLLPHMFQTKNRTENTSLLEQYNGVGKVSIDSQNDESLAKAIELSILENIDTIGDDRDEGDRREKQREFKMPVLPQKRKSPRKRNEKVTMVTKDSTDEHGFDRSRAKGMSPLIGTNQQKSNVISEDVVFDMIDDNRGAAVSKLSRKKRRTAHDTEKSTVHGGVRNKEEKEIEEVQEIEDEHDNSCEDLFGDEDNEEVPGDDVAMVTNDKDASGMGIKYPGRSEEKDADQSLGTRYAHDFDRLPNKSAGPGYKYVDIVRKKEERQRLKAFDCKQCEAFYKDMKLTDEEREERMKTCSRHRGHFSPPSTPEHYWSVGFPDTQTCLQRGYMQVSESAGEPHRKRGTNKYKQLF
ncbi:uncharacterized protein [Amphiura filiformis]|uniref:uncharacterized protein n=1 Tax=Amphiura filiformis TaxID=82378 RepID=UPI003B228919